ncbi:MAG: dolichyl-phosphate beta-glucosyltransferase [Candidatus Promineifilaceae bacterium]
MDQQPYLSVVVPAYNEEKRIPATLESMYTYLTKQTFSWELLIVLDGCTDDTIGAVTRFSADKQHIRWIDRQENRGKGYTVREGMLAAKGQIRLFSDADNSTDLSHFDKMRPLFTGGKDIVIASRDGKDAEGATQAVPQSGLKRLLGNLGNLFIQVMAVPGIWDTQCGFKAFSAESAQKIFSHTNMDGWVFDIEALALARRYGYSIGIIGAHWIDAEGSHVDRSHYINSLLETTKLRWNLLTGKYPKR